MILWYQNQKTYRIPAPVGNVIARMGVPVEELELGAANNRWRHV